ncbi:MAG TPA: hypothetical protein VH598_14930 [Verrucomicrobiae bacterium]|jgi:hypothetical protein|nr:hypothetical protein [Verrucomicrobiae bacterium]
MNKTYKQVRTRFGPDVGFEVEAIPFRATQTTELERLKERLLLKLLAQTSAPEQNALLRRAANEAAALAWATLYPLLFFPTLLEEKARTALNQAQTQERVRRHSLTLLEEAV